MGEIEGLIRQALAITMLEYEDKNHLSGNDESRCRTKMELLSMALTRIQIMKSNINNVRKEV